MGDDQAQPENEVGKCDFHLDEKASLRKKFRFFVRKLFSISQLEMAIGNQLSCASSSSIASISD